MTTITKKPIHVSAQISPEIYELLVKISKIDERSKSFYIKKGLEEILRRRQEDMNDIQIADEAEKKWEADNFKTYSMEDVFSHLD